MEADKLTAMDLTPQQEDYLEVENTCCLCGTELIFEHTPDEMITSVKEKAQCPCCKIQLKDKDFILH